MANFYYQEYVSNTTAITADTTNNTAATAITMAKTAASSGCIINFLLLLTPSYSHVTTTNIFCRYIFHIIMDGRETTIRRHWWW